MSQLMKCGHTANARDAMDKPVCAICIGILSGADEPADIPTLTGRMASCAYCGSSRPSDLTLPFFEHAPAHEGDKFYCGCRGWD